MKRPFYRIALPIIAGTMLLFTACEKALDNITETTTSAEDLVAAESAMASAFDVVDDIASTDGRVLKGGSTLLPAGAKVVFSDSVFYDGDGVDFTIDFGPYNPNAPVNGLLCADGKFRAGTVQINVNKPYSELSSVVTATFPTVHPYYVGTGATSTMTKVLGSLVATRTGAETATLEVNNASITNLEGTSTFTSIKNFKRTAGNGDAGCYGDMYEVTGNGSGTNHNGEEYEMEITETLVKKIQDGCANTFVSGVIALKNKGASGVLTIDFDPAKEAACDSQVEVTLPGGVKKTFELR